jgi:hypothetical protein
MGLKEYYESAFLLRYKYQYSSETIENMIPWELSIELSMIESELNKEIQRRNKQS